MRYLLHLLAVASLWTWYMRSSARADDVSLYDAYGVVWAIGLLLVPGAAVITYLVHRWLRE
jgi:hypothetical protein